MKEFGILTFQSTHHAMRAEKILASEGITTKTIPTPRDISLSCGLAIRVSVEDIKSIRELSKNSELEYKELYHLSTNEGQRKLEKLD